jgi:hypothetical protein
MKHLTAAQYGVVFAADFKSRRHEKEYCGFIQLIIVIVRCYLQLPSTTIPHHSHVSRTGILESALDV